MKNNKIITSLLLVVTMLITTLIFPYTEVLAKNGPNNANTSAAFIMADNSDTYIYSHSGKNLTKVKGLSYDKKTNTLTMKDYSGKYIETNEMGDDFKIKVVGKCKLEYILVWGYGYGGGLTFTGTGTLNISNNTKNYYGDGILLLCEGAKSQLKVQKGVTINIKVKQSNAQAVFVNATKHSKPISLAKGVKITKGSVETWFEKVQATIDIPTPYGWTDTYYLCQKSGVQYAYMKISNNGEYSVDVYEISEDKQSVTKYQSYKCEESELAEDVIKKNGYTLCYTSKKLYYGGINVKKTTIKAK